MKNNNDYGKVTTTVILSLAASTMLHATNGDLLIAVGAKSRGMGGTGIALSHGAESTLNNPALITNVKGTEISFGGTIFMPTIETTIGNSTYGMPQGTYSSEADINMIPEVSLAHKLTDNWYIGIGMWGTAGMGTDYSSASMDPMSGQYGNFNMVTNLQLMQFGVPIAYKIDGLSIAVTPIMQYGNLDINYKMPTANGIETIGEGLSQDFAFGYSLGASYNFHNGVVLGAVYKSSIEMSYGDQLKTAAAPFNQMLAAYGQSIYSGDILEQPAEIGVGIAYTMGLHTFAFDYKNIQWSDAQGYADFGWEDQDIYAFGYEYTQENWTLRLGYNHASSAVVELNTNNIMTMGANSASNFFNLLGFPATAEDHYTVGGTYMFSEIFSLDLAYVYAPSVTETYATPAFSGNPMTGEGFGIDSVTTDHKESSFSFQLTYKF